tara:strand:+ start:399 stop:1205 length:807 start_codon:yes stop_codon:yes gene_type:complete
MKKIILLFFAVISCQTYAQTYSMPIPSDVINSSNNEVFYSGLKQHLKEMISLQSLLSENRIEEIGDFMTENGYLSREAMSYEKFEQPLKYRISIFITEINQEKFNDFSVVFSFFKILEGSEYSNSLTLEELNSLKTHLIKILDPTFDNYYGHRDFVKKVTEQRPGTIKIVDRYKAIIDQASGPLISRASNTTISFKDNYLFWGPGKTLYTNLEWKIKEESPDSYKVYLQLKSHNSQSSNYPNPIDKKPFNTKYFMSLENFNDRIWLDN